jgi:hypothetical protein
MKTFLLDEIPELVIRGRNLPDIFHNRNPLVLFWTASGFECRITSSELWVELESRYTIYEPWISVRINGVQTARFMVPPGRSWFCLYRGFPAGRTVSVQLLKDTQAMPADPSHVLFIYALRADVNAVFLPVPRKKHCIEFVGDSITTGEGLSGALSEQDWLPAWMATDGNYTLLTAEMLDSDYRIVSQSGWGVYTGWDNNIYNNIPAYYKQVCGVVPGTLYESLGAHTDYDFMQNPADIVVVNLGTNDSIAFSTPGWTDPSDGSLHKLRCCSDGTPDPDDVYRISESIRSFLAVIRNYNPHALIVWCQGMITIPLLAQHIYRAVENYCKESGDIHTVTVDLPSMDLEKTEEKGSRGHPGKITHRRAAEVLAAQISRILSTLPSW